MPTTTFRRDVRVGLVALGNDFKNANPTLLLKVHHRRPRGFTGDLPALYVGSKNEAVEHRAGIRQRTMEPQLVLVFNPAGSEEEVADEMDTLVDTFLDYVTLHPHAISSNTVTGVTSIRDIELDIDEVPYPAVVFTLGETIAQEGRSRTGA